MQLRMRTNSKIIKLNNAFDDVCIIIKLHKRATNLMIVFVQDGRRR